jgi:hypothetical protein
MTDPRDSPAVLAQAADRAMAGLMAALDMLREAGVDRDGYTAAAWIMSRLYSHPTYAKWPGQGRSAAKGLFGKSLADALHLQPVAPVAVTRPAGDAAD